MTGIADNLVAVEAAAATSYHDKLHAAGWERVVLYRKAGRAHSPDGGPVVVTCDVEEMMLQFAVDPVAVAEAELAALVGDVDGTLGPR